MYAKFKPDQYWFALVYILNKLCLVVARVLVTNRIMRVSICILFIVLFLVFKVSRQPFASDLNNRSSTVCDVPIILLLLGVTNDMTITERCMHNGDMSCVMEQMKVERPETIMAWTSILVIFGGALSIVHATYALVQSEVSTRKGKRLEARVGSLLTRMQGADKARRQGLLMRCRETLQYWRMQYPRAIFTRWTWYATLQRDRRLIRQVCETKFGLTVAPQLVRNLCEAATAKGFCTELSDEELHVMSLSQNSVYQGTKVMRSGSKHPGVVCKIRIAEFGKKNSRPYVVRFTTGVHANTYTRSYSLDQIKKTMTRADGSWLDGPGVYTGDTGDIRSALKGDMPSELHRLRARKAVRDGASATLNAGSGEKHRPRSVSMLLAEEQNAECDTSDEPAYFATVADLCEWGQQHWDQVRPI